MNKIKLVVLVAIITILVSGCVQAPKQEVLPTATVAPTLTLTPTPTPKTFVPGESTNDGLTRFTLNSVRYTSFNNSRYIITDITVENISPNRSRSYGVVWHFKVFDSEGYTYNPEFDDELIVSKSFNGANMLPGDKRRGEISFKIPDDVMGLKLRFMWDPKNNVNGTTFKLSD